MVGNILVKDGESSQNENFILIEENQTNENEILWNIEKHVEIVEKKKGKQKITKLKKMGNK